MIFARVVDGVFGDFDHQVLVGNHRLTAQARVGLQAPCLVEQVFFQLARFFQTVETFADDDVASGAGTGFSQA